MLFDLLLSMLILNPADTLFNYNNVIEESVSLSDKLNKCEFTFTIYNRSFTAGDDIEILAYIKNTGNDTLLAWDPDYFGYLRPDTIDNEYRLLSCDLYSTFQGDGHVCYKLMKLNPGDSVTYVKNIYIDPSFKPGKYENFRIDCAGSCFLYDKDLEYLTAGADSSIHIKSSTMVKLLFSQFWVFTGSIDISISERKEYIPSD
ncbi:MAG: hypothetical protein JSW64_12175 [Candidatus Zixiibacteriota bacterium]|nr:MAG: hypothetical protein JSW64_12175 [candidate division Zixibacteria bacterium]